jgi:murein DD-endopeptidase MepM/ murein hydrolase activator NlpD
VPSHRADKPAAGRFSRGVAAIPGGAHARQRPSRLRAVLPAAVGVTALTLATVGTLTVSAPEAGSATLAAAGPETPTPSATDGVLSASTRQALAGRERAVSRDSQRTARRDAASDDLQAVAEKKARERTAALARLAAAARRQAERMTRDTWQLPVTPGAYHLTSRFGQCSSLWSSCHTGLDFAAPSGTPLHAVANGTITEMASAGAYGNRTIETLEDGTELWYCHQSAFVAEVGQKVTAGQVIGAVGATGNTTGAHVHLEVRPGAKDPVDPFAVLVSHDLRP